MREYLFRGKKWDNSEWVYGDLIQSINTDNKWILPISESDLTNTIAVIPETVGQYIGWKDKKGGRVFTDDQIEIEWLDGENTVETIRYSEEYGYFKYGNNPICELKDPFVGINIVGNIHDFSL